MSIKIDPKKEPFIRVGIVLPEDQQKSITIYLGDFDDYKFTPELQNNTASSLEFICRGNLICAGISVGKEFQIEQNRKEFDNNKPLTLGPVTTGRGFHWEKQIEAQLSGDLEITSRNGFLKVVNTVPAEQYLMCVATSEMSSDCPSAFVEAQTIAARSWLFANVEKKHADLGIDVCNDDCCQRYQGIPGITDYAILAAKKSAGKVLMYENEVCDARYSKSCGGVTEAGVNVWPQEDLDYLVSIQDGEPAYCGPDFISDSNLYKYLGSVDEYRSYFRWNDEILQEEMIDHINKIHSLNGEAVTGIENEKRGSSGRILSCDLVYVDSNNQKHTKYLESEYSIRQTLSPSFLFSSAFKMNPQNIQKGIPESFLFEGKGWGHGAGMCQLGALGMALNGFSVDSILTHYFPKAKLTRIYS